MPTIQQLREARGWTQKELGDQMGDVSQTAVSYWESGRSEPLASQYRRLGEVFGVLMEDIELVTAGQVEKRGRGRPPKQPAN